MPVPGVGDQQAPRPRPRRRASPARSRSRAMLSRLMFSTASGVELKRVVVARVHVADVARRSPAAACPPSRCRRAGTRRSRQTARPRAGRTPRRAPRGPGGGCRGSQVGLEARIGRHRMVRLRIERVVDRHAVARAEARVTRGRRVAAAVGEHEIVAREQRPKRVVAASPSSRSSVAGASTSQNTVIAPVAAARARRSSSRSSKTPTPLALTTTSASRAASTRQRQRPPLGRRVDDHRRPRRVGDVAVLPGGRTRRARRR